MSHGIGLEPRHFGVLMVVIGADDAASLGWPEAIDAMRRAMSDVSADRIIQPPRQVSALFDMTGYLGVMTASSSSLPVFGAKIVSLKPENASKGLPTIQGMVLLFESSTGAPVAFVDGAAVTAIRTAAASALATRELARSNAGTHGILGTGLQATMHALAIGSLFPSLETLIWGRDLKKADELAKRLSIETGRPFRSVSGAEMAARCDIVSSVTSATAPLIQGQWISAGAHLNLVGAHSPETREADSETMRRAAVYVDSLESALREAGEILIPIRENVFSAKHIIGEIGQLIQGSIPGRRSSVEITVYKSLGLAAQDIYASAAILKEYEKRLR